MENCKVKLNERLSALGVGLFISSADGVKVSGSKAEGAFSSAPHSLGVSLFFLSKPLESLSKPLESPWYDSDWVILVSCGVLVLGAVYFLTKKDDGDDGHGGVPGSISGSGIVSSRGLLDLLPPKEDSSGWGWLLDLYTSVRYLFMHVRYLCLCMTVRRVRSVCGRFAANPGNGESSDRLRLRVFSMFPYGSKQSIRKIICISSAVNRPFSSNLHFNCNYSTRRLFSSSSPAVSSSSLRQYILLTLSHVECTEERLKLSADAIIGQKLLFAKA